VVQSKSNYKPYLGYAAAGLVVATVVLLCGMPILSAISGGVVYLRALMPFEHTDVSPLPLAEQVEPSAKPDDTAEQRLVEMLFEQDKQFTYKVEENSPKWQVVRMRVTGYCTCPKCCGKYSDGVTASKHHIRPGDTFVAADKFYRFGTEMIIPGYNNDRPVEVKDRGRVIKGNRLDVFFNSHETAKKWGTRYLDVLVRVEK